MDNERTGKRIEEIRRRNHLTQAQLAEKLRMTPQAVSSWERGETAPDIGRLHDLAALLNTTESFLLEGEDGKSSNYRGKIFDEKHMYTYLKGYASSRNMTQTLRALPYAKEKHAGQYRKGPEKIPYIIHPLSMACHALSMGITEDETIAVALLHDVCEDCGVKPEELPFSSTVQEAVKALTYVRQPKQEYYQAISGNRRAAIVKLIDRCNNVSSMAFGMDDDHITKYIAETRTYVLPLLTKVKNSYPEYGSQVHLLQYQICSIIDSVEQIMSGRNR
jgi:transcriptional regulator with XRE-family HTH domain